MDRMKKRKGMDVAEKYFLCDKISVPHSIPTHIELTCCKCGELVGLTKASYDRFKKIKNVQTVCVECFKKESKEGLVVKRPTIAQIKELREFDSEFDETDIRRAMDKMKKGMNEHGHRR